MLPRPERRGESCCERRVSAEQADYLQGEDREGGVTSSRCSVPPDTLFPGCEQGKPLHLDQQGQTRPRHG